MRVEGGPVAIDERGAELLFGELAAAYFVGVSGLIGEVWGDM